MHRTLVAMVVAAIAVTSVEQADYQANEQDKRQESIQNRMKYYVQFQDFVIPWYYLAAIDQYERNIQAVRQDIPTKDSLIAIQFSNEYWAGSAPAALFPALRIS